MSQQQQSLAPVRHRFPQDVTPPISSTSQSICPAGHTLGKNYGEFEKCEECPVETCRKCGQIYDEKHPKASTARKQPLQQTDPTPAPTAVTELDLFPIKEERILGAVRHHVARATEAPEVQGNDQAEFAVTRAAVKEVLKRLDHVAATIAKEYDSFLRRKGPAIGTRKYITKDRTIQENISKKRNQHFFQIVEWLYGNCLSMSATVSKGFSFRKAGGEKRLPAVVKPDVVAIADLIGKSESHVRKYLQVMEEAGFIRRPSATVKHTSAGAYYVLGLWGKAWFDANGNQRRPKVSWFIQNKPEIIQKLRTWSRPD